MVFMTAPPLVLAAGKAQAEVTPEQQLRDVEKRLEESRKRQKELDDQAGDLEKEITSLRQQMVTAANAAQDTEEDLSSLEGQVKDLRQQESSLRQQLTSQDEQMVEVLMGLERLALRPPESLLVQPDPAEETVRSAILLRSVIPQIRLRADDLRDKLQQLSSVRQQISSRKKDISRTVKKLDSQNATLTGLLQRKQSLQKSTQDESKAMARRAEELAANAISLRELLAKLEIERKQREEEARRLASLVVSKPAPPVIEPPPEKKAPAMASRENDGREHAAPENNSPQLAAAVTTPSRRKGKPEELKSLENQRGAMPLPARGQIVARYGQADGLGGTRKGILVRTRGAAQVVSPGEGVVAFAGSFRGYGQLLIMEHGGGYHTLLSGMSRITATVGQHLLAGEPVGVMDDSDSPTLYLELRQDGQPINPLPWLTARKG